jgi:hypothetical protein
VRVLDEIPWYRKPTRDALTIVYERSAEEAGLSRVVEKEKSVVIEPLIDPLVVEQLWRDDDGIRAALVRYLDALTKCYDAWDLSDQEIQRALEEDRIAKLAELWRFYSPTAYATFVESTR